MSQDINNNQDTDPNVVFLEQTILDMENELSNASFGGDRQKIPLLMKQLKEARRILSKMTGEE